MSSRVMVRVLVLLVVDAAIVKGKKHAATALSGADQDDTCWPVLIPQGSTNHLFGDCKKASLGFCAGLKGNSTIMSPGQYYFMDEASGCAYCPEGTAPCAIYQDGPLQRKFFADRVSTYQVSPIRPDGSMRNVVMCRTKGDHFCKPAAFPYFTDLDLTGASWTGKTMAPPAHYAMQIGGTKYLEQESQSNHLFATVDVYAGSWTIACNIWKIVACDGARDSNGNMMCSSKKYVTLSKGQCYPHTCACGLAAKPVWHSPATMLGCNQIAELNSKLPLCSMIANTG